MRYTLDGRKLPDEEAENLKKRNEQIVNEVYETGDFSKLLEIEWLLSEEVMDAISK